MTRGKNIIIICGSETPAGVSEPLFSWAAPPQSSRFARCQLPQGDAKPSQALPRQLSQRESQAVKLVAKVLKEMRTLPAVLLPLPLRKDFPRSGGRCRAATKGGVWHRAAMTERAHAVALSAKASSATRNFATTQKSSPFRGSWHAVRRD